jgi:aspartate racemase
MHSPIAILGGMGPQASLRFQELLIKKSESYHSGDGNQYPYIIHFSLPVTDFISDESAKQHAITTLNNLEGNIRRLNPSQLTLACNTAHLLVPDVQLLQHASFVSMLDEVAAMIYANNIKTVGIMSSPVTIYTKLYESVLRKKGIAVILPDERQITQLEQVIRAVIRGAAGEKEARVLLRIARALVLRGAQAIVLGCTELPLAFPKGNAPAPIYDTLEIYAQAVIDRYYSV